MKYRVQLSVAAGSFTHTRDDVVEAASLEEVMDNVFSMTPEPPKEIGNSFALTLKIEPAK